MAMPAPEFRVEKDMPTQAMMPHPCPASDRALLRSVFVRSPKARTERTRPSQDSMHRSLLRQTPTGRAQRRHRRADYLSSSVERAFDIVSMSRADEGGEHVGPALEQPSVLQNIARRKDGVTGEHVR